MTEPRVQDEDRTEHDDGLEPLGPAATGSVDEPVRATIERLEEEPR